MRVFVGQTRSRKLIAELVERGWGECTNRGEFPPRRSPWFLDNGAFSDWKSGRDFDGVAFVSDLISGLAAPIPPDFIVCPDRVATGLDSLEFSRRWFVESESRLQDLRAHVSLSRARWFLAVQDGMTEIDVERAQDTDIRFAGIFVGGTLPWKLRTGDQWVRFAHARGLPVHIGRVGTNRRVAWARRIGADSIDSCLPLWSRENLETFAAALANTQTEMW